jgi:hypothetical protein
MTFAPGSVGGVAEHIAVKKNDIFYRKIASIKSPTPSFVIKRKLIVNAKHSRNMAPGPYCEVAHPTGSDNIVTLRRTFLVRLISFGRA